MFLDIVRAKFMHKFDIKANVIYLLTFEGSAIFAGCCQRTRHLIDKVYGHFVAQLYFLLLLIRVFLVDVNKKNLLPILTVRVTRIHYTYVYFPN